MRQVLEVDFRHVGTPYCGPTLHEDIPERGVKVDVWGRHTRWVEHKTGGYQDFCEFPLMDADEEAIARWPLPSPDDFDYSAVREACERIKGYAIHVGGPGLGDIINSNGMVRGME